MRKYLPEFIKSIIRFLYYKNERNKIFREIKIRSFQDELLEKEFSNQVEKLIIFIVEGANWFTGKDQISGGIMSIASICEESKKLREIHHSEVIMVTKRGANLLLKHTQFPNQIHVYRFQQLSYFKNVSQLLVHIPEYMFQDDLINSIYDQFKHIPSNKIHFNILNQNIDFMPQPDFIQKVKQKACTVTQTTAHDQYSTSEVKSKYGIPLHKLSVYATPERYNYKTYTEKENIILLSPDLEENKESIIKKLSVELPEFECKVINEITYLQYLEWIEKAKYMISFGEGLDFYFIETVFSGGVSFASYNDKFFTNRFKGLIGVFDSYSCMLNKICETIKHLEQNELFYLEANKAQFSECHKIYNGDFYRENLMNFYKRNYLFP
jgi:hypothetical protein